ncbi:MAG: alkaline phosphatase [Muricauda sp.]|nr:alkaline phosphatase [Allomuricauda sp.]MBA4746919.1 alkaline phosphatase [Allomuricauda sp.]
MKKRAAFLVIVGLIFFVTGKIFAQTVYKVHSHNDYAQKLPFWYAYSNGASSIEADVFLRNDSLYVTHAEDEIVKGKTFDKLYLNRLSSLERSGELRPLQLLIDIKSEAYATLGKLEEILRSYPNLIKADKIKFVISGNRPKPEEYKNYPSFIWFDHQNLDELEHMDLSKVALISSSYKNYSVWNGYGRMTALDLEKAKKAIAKAKTSGRPFQFWGTPDTKTAWARLAKLGVDYINTDRPALAKQYLDKLDANTFTLKDTVEVYRPKYAYNTDTKPTNIILMIGDGNGLAQISSAMIANRGKLSVTGLKNIGLVKTASHDDLITDSAAGATAMATGRKTNNRAIGTGSQAEPLTNLVDMVSKKGFNTAIVATDAIYGATPSSFYAHRVERDDTPGLIEDLKSSPLDFFIAGGEKNKKNIEAVFSEQELEHFSDFKRPTAIYLGDNKAPSIADGRGDALPKSVAKALTVLGAKNNPFFLMVEGAQIDNGGHSNSTGDIIREMLDFDQAIAEALKFADADKNTLVIITADHETSGFGIVGGSMKDGIVQGDFLTVDHTGIMVPLFAYGPGAKKFSGVYENTYIFDKILEVLK